jgi:uncharacterized protein YyaL (SSP411 family)
MAVPRIEPDDLLVFLAFDAMVQLDDHLAGAGDERAGELTPLLHGRELLDGRPTAFVCERYSCRLPVTDAADLRAQLDDALAVRRR